MNTKLIRKLIIEFADGTTEEWEFPLGDTRSYYRETHNYQTVGGEDSTIIARWKEHEVRWTSNRWERPGAEQPMETIPLKEWIPEYDRWGRPTGRRVPPGSPPALPLTSQEPS